MIGIDVGEAETEAFWREFLRGLRGPRPVRRRAGRLRRPRGSQEAIAQVLGCPWQRCTVHFLRDMLGHVHRKASSGWSRRRIRQIFAAEELGEARGAPAPSVVASARGSGAQGRALLLEEAEEDLLAFMAFPAEHWAKLRSTNPLERVNREIGAAQRRGRHLPQRRSA